MKELKSTPIIETHYPLKQRGNKRWAIAKSKTYNKPLLMQNSCVEAAYIRILQEVKNHFLGAGTVYYEHNSRNDKTLSLMAMHSFITPSFYFHLQCNFLYEYEVEYAFCNCGYEGTIRELLKPYPLDRQAKQVDLKPDYETFYKMVILMVDPQFVHTL
jgi:hypothetical protein